MKATILRTERGDHYSLYHTLTDDFFWDYYDKSGWERLPARIEKLLWISLALNVAAIVAIIIANG